MKQDFARPGLPDQLFISECRKNASEYYCTDARRSADVDASTIVIREPGFRKLAFRTWINLFSGKTWCLFFLGNRHYMGNDIDTVDMTPAAVDSIPRSHADERSIPSIAGYTLRCSSIDGVPETDRVHWGRLLRTMAMGDI